jgi:ParB-like chromosome segregation protein Spo0J
MAAKQHDGSNGSISGEDVAKYLTEIDKADDKLIELKIDHMDACKGPRGHIRGVMKEARKSGVNMEALRALIAKHREERKIEQRIAELEDDDRADYEQMQEALGAFGDTDLGQAALRKAKPKRKGDDALDSLRT